MRNCTRSGPTADGGMKSGADERAGRDDAFAALVESVAACRHCPAMEGRRRVLTATNGDIDAPVLFIAEAPGRGGAERTGVPFSGDFSGRTFERLLDAVGWTRADIFITNAALCNPQGPTGANRPPSRLELANCSGHLRATLAIVDPSVVVTLGAVALAALGRIEAHGLKLSEARGMPYAWYGRTLVPLFHPSPKVLAWFPYERMDADFRALRAIVDGAITTKGGGG
ncbi:MAG: uracil-DNA glycosylase, partial [Thermomicrobia bacterium]|nr:uracil-DNA glycosylase [Thermomicrobia bacterium]MCA1725300.1 uracil-DNA glycosylase [Thermomicrobia bacterium]